MPSAVKNICWVGIVGCMISWAAGKIVPIGEYLSVIRHGGRADGVAEPDLSQIGRDRTVILKALSDDNIAVRVAAQELVSSSLLLLGGSAQEDLRTAALELTRQAYPLIKKAATSLDRNERLSAVRSIAVISVLEPASTMEPLLVAATDEDVAVRDQAFRGILVCVKAGIRHPMLMRKATDSLLIKPDRKGLESIGVRRNAIDLIVLLGRAEAVPRETVFALVEVAKSGEDPENSMAVWALGELGPKAQDAISSLEEMRRQKTLRTDWNAELQKAIEQIRAK
jgi:hypothetical protein